ncbi:subtilase-type protease inhibitor [Streptomyces sp. JJ38]|uniref:subtilase-type protease inhibitor n=1 Tax=Streptomyces sp. JJ38 TaxID=2738128 RepID=UPI001C57AE34|nr:subtilase-type protease inhibitor [Streptomyces sp. JJ38]MBW1600004.1 protease inhibitor protein [Streptomyces sp. JJ38]
MRKTAKLAVGALITAAALVPFGGTAHAAPASLYAPSALALTVASGDTAATATPERAVTLSCTPSTTGTHPDPAAACADLARVDGDFGSLAADPERFCPLYYDPVVVTAVGVWNGQRVSYERTYGNACQLGAEAHSVFAF